MSDLAKLPKKEYSDPVKLRQLPETIPNGAHGVIAINEDGNCFLMQLFNSAPDWVKQGIVDFDCVKEATGCIENAGLYYVRFTGSYCGGAVCSGPECAGDCFEMDFEIIP